MSTIRPGTKSAAAVEVMTRNSKSGMDKVIPKIAEAAGLTLDKARHYYVLFVRKGLAPGVVPPRAAATTKASKKPSKAVNKDRLKAANAKRKAKEATEVTPAVN